MPDRLAHRYFFAHVMKTGGTTFHAHVMRNFKERAIYPAEGIDGDKIGAHVMVPRVLGLTPERKAEVQVFSVHFPIAVAWELRICDLVTLTLLREPVTRTISYLRHIERNRPEFKGWDLEKIYQDEFHFRAMLENHQSKVFSMRPDDRFKSYMDVFRVDAARLEAAKQNLERANVVGLTERFGDFLRLVEEDYGWTFSDVPDQNVAPGGHEPRPGFVDRIKEDNVMDMEFYEYGKALVERRLEERRTRQPVR